MKNKLISLVVLSTFLFGIEGCYKTPTCAKNSDFKEEGILISVDDISYLQLMNEYQSIQVITFDKQELQDYKVVDNEDGSKDVILHIDK